MAPTESWFVVDILLTLLAVGVEIPNVITPVNIPMSAGAAEDSPVYIDKQVLQTLFLLEIQTVYREKDKMIQTTL
mgnify:CR=1 FL=1